MLRVIGTFPDTPGTGWSWDARLQKSIKRIWRSDRNIALLVCGSILMTVFITTHRTLPQKHAFLSILIF